MNKKQTKILKIFSLITLSAGAIGGTSAALISCNKETPFAIKTAIIDSTGTKITLTYNGNIPSDFANNLKVKEDDKFLIKKTDWTISSDNLNITLTTFPATKDNKLYILYNDQTTSVNADNDKAVNIRSAEIDESATKITIKFNGTGTAPSDFISQTILKINGDNISKNNLKFESNFITISNYFIDKDDKINIQYKNENLDIVNTSKISGSVALLTTNGARVSLTNVDDINKLYVDTKLELPNGLQRKDISVITVYNATVASAFALTANENDKDNDNWGNLKTIDLSRSNATSIVQVIHNDYKFNGDIIFPTNLTTIGNDFLRFCFAFNQPLTLPNSITSIGDYFLSDCHDAFNQPLTLPNSITSIGDNFLAYCRAFNQPLTLSNSITSIVNSFLYDCAAFNQPLTLPNSITSIGDNFLAYCGVFNQPLTLPNSITTIGVDFLRECLNFNNNNTVFDLSNLNSNIVIHEGFLYKTILENINIGSLSASVFIASDGSFAWPIERFSLKTLYVKGDHASDLVQKFPSTANRHLAVE